MVSVGLMTKASTEEEGINKVQLLLISFFDYSKNLKSKVARILKTKQNKQQSPLLFFITLMEHS